MVVTGIIVRSRQPLSKVSVSQAAKLTGKSRETINKATQDGKLSFSRNGSNHKQIDVSELERIYPFVTTIDEINKKPKTVTSSPPSSEPDTGAELAALREKIASSERANEMLTAERQRERRQLEDEIENLRGSLEKYQEQHSKALLLITDQSEKAQQRVGEWEAPLAALRKQVAAQERQQQELRDKAQRRIKSLQQALENEQSKSWLQKLLG